MNNTFNDEEFVARSPKEWVASMYLSTQQKVIDDVYFFLKSNDNSGDKVRGRRSLVASLWSLFYLCRPRMKSSKSKVNINNLVKLITSDKDNDLLEALDIIFEYLEADLKLTDIANIQKFDRKDVFKSNKMSGYS